MTGLELIELGTVIEPLHPEAHPVMVMLAPSSVYVKTPLLSACAPEAEASIAPRTRVKAKNATTRVLRHRLSDRAHRDVDMCAPLRVGR